MSPVVKTRSTGFTLIELLVVVFIIGILVAATLTIIPKVQRAVRGTQTSAQLTAIASAIQAYYNDFRAYPGPLPNNQLYWSADSINGNQPNASGFQLKGVAAYSQSMQLQYNPPTTVNFGYTVTAPQNLVLGLLGGLELQTTAGAVTGFVYNPQNIFLDGVAPSPKGPASLNFNNPKRQQAYLQIKAGEISTPNIANNGGTGASFVDSTNDLTTMNKRSPADAMIPVFLDKYSDPLPLLYYRTNVGGSAIVGFRNTDAASSGTALKDANNDPLVAQYDLFQDLCYVTSRIGCIGTVSDHPDSIHGLQDLGNQTNLSDTIDIKNAAGNFVPSNSGKNAIAYFKDPTLNPPYNATAAVQPNNTFQGVARQKDGYILISAGPDRLYGTHDDLVYPGPLQPAQ